MTWTTGIQLPDGAVIDYLRVYYRDNDSDSDLRATLYRYDNVGASHTIAAAHSSGTPGWSSSLSPLFSETVDNVNYSYAVHLFLEGTGNYLQACAVRLRYQF
jgi:hypothetical protein